MSPTFLVVAGLILFGLLLVAIILARRAGTFRRRGNRADESAAKRRIFGFPIDEIPLEHRPRTLKVCPDCRELVFLGAAVCKYCGCALVVEGQKAPELVLRRSERTAGEDGRKKSPSPPPEPRPASPDGGN